MSTETQVPAEPPAPPPRRRGLTGTVVDMVRSLGVVLLLVAAIALITIRPGDDGDGVRVVDYAVELTSARVAAPYEVLAPDGLTGYRATSVRFTSTDDGIVWHLGFVSPDDAYVGVDQTDGDGEALVEQLTKAARPVEGDAAFVDLGGRSWQRYDEGGDEGDEQVVRGLVLDGDGVTTLVAGTAGWQELEEMAAALSATGGVDDATVTPG